MGLDLLGGLVDWMRGAGPPGVLVFVAVYVAAAVCLLPGSVLMIGAGAAYGPLWGTLIAAPASAVAATAAFLVGRTVARRRVACWASGHPRFGAIDAAIGEDGFRLVLLIRLSPLFPANLLNYALGLTRVRTRDYALATLVGMLPVTLLYVSTGALVGDLARAAHGTAAGGPFRYALSALGLAATLAVTAWVSRLARRSLAAATGDRA